jgi:hypothetical protein
MSQESELYSELLRLRSRRGIERPDLGADLGPRIRALSAVPPSAREALVKQRVAATLQKLIDGLPPDLQQAARLAFALDKNHRYPTLDERVRMLAEQQKYSERTARRLMDRALQTMVAEAEAEAEADAEAEAADPGAGAASAGPGWRVTSLTALFRLDTPTPELYEMRKIVATRDIAEVTVRLGLPPAPNGQMIGDVTVEALFGVRIAMVERAPERHHYRLVLSLPRVVPADEEHEFWLRVVLPPSQPTWPHYAIVPLNPCDSGTVRVRFSPGRPPAAVWLLDEVPYLDLNDETPGPERIRPDSNGDVTRDFSGLREGYGYGVAWTHTP